jgi:AraC-like DNA-binding protein
MPQCHVVGQQDRPLFLNATGRTGIVIVRFKPWGASALFGDTLPELKNSIIDLELLWGQSSMSTLVERVTTATSHRKQAEIVGNFVTSLLFPEKPDKLSMASVAIINQSWGRRRIEDIAGEFGLGRRQFNRRFTQTVGTSPKQMSTVLRAQKAIACIRSGRDVNDVIDQCGYSDQSHLIRNITAMSNKRPTELSRLRASRPHRYFNCPKLDTFCGTTYL